MQAMKAYGGSGGTTSFLNLGARWWSRPRLCTPLGEGGWVEEPRYQLTSKEYDFHGRMIKNFLDLRLRPLSCILLHRKGQAINVLQFHATTPPPPFSRLHVFILKLQCLIPHSPICTLQCLIPHYPICTLQCLIPRFPICNSIHIIHLLFPLFVCSATYWLFLIVFISLHFCRSRQLWGFKRSSAASRWLV